MTQSFSYAVVLHRIFDSAPPENEPVFRVCGRVLRHYKKPEGLYVFVDEPEQTLEITCRGYQPERITATQGETHHVVFYPDSSAFISPTGWSVTLQRAPPGSLFFVADERFDIRILAFDSGSGVARLRAKPGFLGGCLRLTRGDYRQTALILGKEPPDRYYLSALGADASGEKTTQGFSALDADFSGGKAEKGYAARADAKGYCAFVTPQDFAITEEQLGRDALLHLE